MWLSGSDSITSPGRCCSSALMLPTVSLCSFPHFVPHINCDKSDFQIIMRLKGRERDWVDHEPGGGSAAPRPLPGRIPKDVAYVHGLPPSRARGAEWFKRHQVTPGAPMVGGSPGIERELSGDLEVVAWFRVGAIRRSFPQWRTKTKNQYGRLAARPRGPRWAEPPAHFGFRAQPGAKVSIKGADAGDAPPSRVARSDLLILSA